MWSTQRYGSHPSCTPKQGCRSRKSCVQFSLDSTEVLRARVSPSTQSSRRCAPLHAATRSPNSRSSSATKAWLASILPAQKLDTHQLATSTLFSSFSDRTSTPPSTRERRSVFPQSGKPCSFAAPNAWATVCASLTTSPASRVMKCWAAWRSLCAIAEFRSNSAPLQTSTPAYASRLPSTPSAC